MSQSHRPLVCVLLVGPTHEATEQLLEEVLTTYPAHYAVTLSTEIKEYYADHVDQPLSLAQVAKRTVMVANAAVRAFRAFVPLMRHDGKPVIIQGFPVTSRQVKRLKRQLSHISAKIVTYFAETTVASELWNHRKETLIRVLKRHSTTFKLRNVLSVVPKPATMPLAA